MFQARIILPLVLAAVLSAAPLSANEGVLLLAHGGSPEWNGRVTEVASRVNASRPTEVAFGMAARGNIQAAIDRLVARGVTQIVAVPLFVSSWSSVITSTEYLLGLRREAPAALAAFAKMSHGHGAEHAAHGAADGMSPVTSRVPIRMTPALNRHPIAAAILATRARSISRDPAREAVIIVAHGPNDDEFNRRWLADIASLADQVRATERFASIDYLTLRDDAPAPIRDGATAQLRDLVMKHSREGRRVLIVPLLISFGGIDKGLRQRLEGLSYAIPEAALMPDDRIATWVLAMAEGR